MFAVQAASCTSTLPPAMAVSLVFGSFELLEQILLELPLRQLLLAERINKACCDVVGRSSGIQKALFLAPNGETAYPTGASSPLTQLWWQTTKWYSASEEGAKQLSSLWQETERLNSDGKHERFHNETAEMLEKLSGLIQHVRPITNPFLTVNGFADPKSQGLNLLMGTHDLWPSKIGCGIFLKRSHHRGGKYTMNALDPSEIIPGSWESMFATQPPVSKISVLLSDTSVEKEMQGNCLQDLYEACEMSWEGGRSCTLYHSYEWVHTASDVDSVTGFEMLRMMDMSHEGLVREGLLWRGETEDF